LPGLLILLFTAADAPQPPAPPKISSFAPADELAGQLQTYLQEMQADLEKPADYTATGSKITKDANTVVILALHLGLHDEPNEFKAKAPAIIAAGLALAEATEYEAAKAGYEKLKQAAATGGESGELEWKPVASLGQLMKQVNVINAKLRRSTRGSRLKSTAQESTRLATVLAAIGQAAIYDTHEVKDQSKVGEWYELAAGMRDASAALNRAIKTGDEKVTAEAIKALDQNCTKCHNALGIRP
jgi:hypothetical protein